MNIVLNNSEVSNAAAVSAPLASSGSIDFVPTLAQQIVSQPGVCPDDIILYIQRNVGGAQQTIKRICKSLHHPKNLQMIEEILKIQAKEMVRYFPKGGLYNGINFPRIIYRHTAWLSLEQTLEAMDHKLMPNLNCGKKPFNMYSKRHQGSLKMFVVYALEYHLDLYLVSTNK